MSDNRGHIMSIALQQFAQYGYDAAGVQQIVDAAGVTKPTLYHYFGSKRGLLEAIVEERSAALTQRVEQATAYQGDITKSITQTVEAFFGFAQEQPVFYRMMLSLWFSPPSAEYTPVVLARFQHLFGCIEAMFKAASKDHGNMRGREQRYAASLRGLIDTYIGLALQDRVKLNDSQLVYQIVHQFMHGIFS